MRQRDKEICVLVAMLRERDTSTDGDLLALPSSATDAQAGECCRCHAAVLPGCLD